MFILIFFVAFGVKKSNLVTYRVFWSFTYYDNLFVLINFSPRHVSNNLRNFLYHRFQFTAVTARPTTYLLFTF